MQLSYKFIKKRLNFGNVSVGNNLFYFIFFARKEVVANNSL